LSRTVTSSGQIDSYAGHTYVLHSIFPLVSSLWQQTRKLVGTSFDAPEKPVFGMFPRIVFSHTVEINGIQ